MDGRFRRARAAALAPTGLVSALCRFEEYRGLRDVIARAADRILELKAFAYRDHVLWKTMVYVPRVLSGAGHGMSGIAEALYAAADVCGDDRYVGAADEALDYELEAYVRYRDKFGTWADLRDFPPMKYMHGYCAGAPGTGIMVRRMMDAGCGGERARALAERVSRSVNGLPLNPYDHLCCGNAAIAECHLTVADHEAAGRGLGALLGRRRREGEYRDAYSGTSGQVSASLFNGISGIGYEMLRYARPHDVPSVLLGDRRSFRPFTGIFCRRSCAIMRHDTELEQCVSGTSPHVGCASRLEHMNRLQET